MSKPNSKSLKSVVDLPLDAPKLKEIVEKAKDWACLHGVAIRPRVGYNPDGIQFAPFTLIPSPFPRREFDKARRLQPALNLLMHKVANDAKFIKETLQATIKVDEFTKRLMDIFDVVQAEGPTQEIMLGMLRNDLMLAQCCGSMICVKQVEINTIASGFGWLGPASGAIQRYILQELNHSDQLKNLPENDALAGLCQGMLDAWQLYDQPQSVILFVVENITYNIADQRFHEYKLRELNPNVTVIRRSLTDIYKTARLGPRKELLIDNFEIGVVYFRAGYEPGHYPSEDEWSARLLIERSLAIKSPTIQYHLAGTKKVQQALSVPGIVAKYIDDPTLVRDIEDIFVGLYSLDEGADGDCNVKMAMDDPERFVLKPQREGGGNNVYGEEIRTTLQTMARAERNSWILMERIRPPSVRGYIVRPRMLDQPHLDDLISELGVFGVVIGDSKNVICNKQVGHMMRTKTSTTNEGGVAAGDGSLDSPCLID